MLDMMIGGSLKTVDKMVTTRLKLTLLQYQEEWRNLLCCHGLLQQYIYYC